MLENELKINAAQEKSTDQTAFFYKLNLIELFF